MTLKGWVLSLGEPVVGMGKGVGVLAAPLSRVLRVSHGHRTSHSCMEAGVSAHAPPCAPVLSAPPTALPQ